MRASENDRVGRYFLLHNFGQDSRHEGRVACIFLRQAKLREDIGVAVVK